MNQDKTPYTEGLEAFIAGMKITQIPYSKLSEKGISWMRGWHTAQYGQMMNGKL